MVEKAIELLNSFINTPRESADDFYYAGVRALFRNDKIAARRCFRKARELGYGDLGKVEQHLEDLKKRR